jgi:hypothetical protein
MLPTTTHAYSTSMNVAYPIFPAKIGIRYACFTFHSHFLNLFLREFGKRESLTSIMKGASAIDPIVIVIGKCSQD